MIILCVCLDHFIQVVTRPLGVELGSWDIDNILYYIYTKTRYQLITKRVIDAYDLFLFFQYYYHTGAYYKRLMKYNIINVFSDKKSRRG